MRKSPGGTQSHNGLTQPSASLECGSLFSLCVAATSASGKLKLACGKNNDLSLFRTFNQRKPPLPVSIVAYDAS